MGLSMEISASEYMVVQAVQAVVNDGIIQGSKEYNKDKFVDKAFPATSSPLFSEYKGTGKLSTKCERSTGPSEFQGKQRPRHAGGALYRESQGRTENCYKN